MEIKVGNNLATLTEVIGQGGEGKVYKLDNKTAVKIYKEELRTKREAKVRDMVKSQIALKTTLISFPKELVHDKKGQFVGFTMNLVSGFKPIHQLYSPKSRKDEFPGTNYQFLIRVAANIARAVGAVHQANCIIGDINHSGILVGKDATVALIDADSFQFSFGSQTHGCLVGVPDFTPPELHGKSLDGVVRTLQHDNFGLAVAIFLLLFMGRHPYAGVYPKNISGLSEAIANDMFAYSELRKASIKSTPPSSAMALNHLQGPIALAFEDSFGLNYANRPQPKTWIHLLELLEKSLSRCTKRKTHYYPSHINSCLWCSFEANTGLDLFPEDYSTINSTNLFSNSGVSISSIKDRISKIKIPLPDTLVPGGKANNIAPSNQAKSLKPSPILSNILPLTGMLGAAAGLVAAPQLFIIWAFIGFWAFGSLNKSPDTGPVLKNFKNASNTLDQICTTVFKSNGYFEAIHVKKTIEQELNDYYSFDEKIRRALLNFHSNREEILLNDHLSKIFIRNSNISGIGPVKAAELASWGIETAADVTHNSIISISGFGPVKAQALLNWKKELSNKFVPSAFSAKTYSDKEQVLKNQLATEKMNLEASIRKNFSGLEQLVNKLNRIKATLENSTTFNSALKEHLQSVVDLNYLNKTNKSTNYYFEPGSELLNPKIPQKNSSSPSATKTRTSGGSQTQNTAQATTKSTLTSHKTPLCPKCNSSMVKRLARKGSNSGNYFWGCSRYPRCKGTRSI